MIYMVDNLTLQITQVDNVMICKDGKVSRSVNVGNGSRTSIEDVIDSRRAYFATFGESIRFANKKWGEKINALECSLVAAHHDYRAFQALYRKKEEAA